MNIAEPAITDSEVTDQSTPVRAQTGRWVTFAALAALVLVWFASLATQLLTMPVHGDDLSYIDLLVYRAGGHAVLHDMSMYTPDFDEANKSPNGLPFTYPPFSGLVFAPFALLSVGAAKLVMVVINAVAMAVFFTTVVLAVGGRWDRLSSWKALTAPISVRTALVVVAAAVLFVATNPVQENANHGQVNMILAALLALDILLPTVPWPRGMLVGLAVAIKLTPAVFIGYFLVTRQWKALAVSLVSAAGAFAVAWLVMPADTARYFSSVLLDADRIGGLAFASNQSIRGVLERIPALDSSSGLLWLLCVAVVLALAIVAIRANYRAHDGVAALLAAAFIGLLCSPVSWGHHWVWLSVALVYFLVRWAEYGGVGNLAAGVAVAAVTILAPWAHLPSRDDRELQWTPIEHVLGNAFTITALVLLAWFALGSSRLGAERRAPIS